MISEERFVAVFQEIVELSLGSPKTDLAYENGNCERLWHG
jgi:hypothetical protein